MTLKERIENCSKCPLRAKLTEFEKPVFGVGSNKPKVMIVIDNNTSESQFLIDGLKLEYLEKNLIKYKINKSDLYITPLVKCARKPTKKSFELCKDWIVEEIKEFKPSFVLLVSAFDFTNYGYLPIEYASYLNGDRIFSKDDIKEILNNTYICNISLSKLSSNSKEDKKYTDIIFTKIKEHCA